MSEAELHICDWHELLEICALFDTLIADVDGVYDPTNYNDRLLLGSSSMTTIVSRDQPN
jgi:DNA invertase Pin-like site-specific DNA recombinase